MTEGVIWKQLLFFAIPLLLVIIMIFRPQGLMGSKEFSIAMFKRAGDRISGLFRKKEKEEKV